MAQVLIRNIDDDTLEAHRARAKARGLSLEQALRDLIEAAAPYSSAERLAVAERLQAQTPPGPRSDPATLIREDRSR